MPDEATAPATSTPVETIPAAPATSIPATAAQPPATPTDTFDLSKFVGTDGKFKEGWQEGLLDDDLKGEKFFEAWGTDIKSILKVAGNQAKMLGKYANTKGILPINERSTPFEVQAFREAMGVPKDGTGYKYTPPEDISSEDFSPEFTKNTFERFNKVNLTDSQAKEMMNIYADQVRTIEKAVTEEFVRLTKDADTRLDAEWGDKKESRMDLSRRFIEKMTDGWNPAKYEELFGKIETFEDGSQGRVGGINIPEFAPLRPLLLDLFATIEEKYGIADTAAVGESGGGGAKTIEQQLVELEATPDFMDGKLRTSFDEKERAKHEELMKQRRNLIAKQVETEEKRRRQPS